MGNCESNEYLTKEDLEFCKTHTRYDEEEIKIKNAKEEKISESSENILETAVVYQKELQSCGQPTVRTVPYEPHISEDRIKDAAVKSFSIAVNDCNPPVKDPNEGRF